MTWPLLSASGPPFPITKLCHLCIADVPYPTLSWPTSLTAAKRSSLRSSIFHLPFLLPNVPQLRSYQYPSPTGANSSIPKVNDLMFSWLTSLTTYGHTALPQMQLPCHTRPLPFTSPVSTASPCHPSLCPTILLSLSLSPVLPGHFHTFIPSLVNVAHSPLPTPTLILTSS